MSTSLGTQKAAADTATGGAQPGGAWGGVGAGSCWEPWTQRMPVCRRNQGPSRPKARARQVTQEQGAGAVKSITS